MNDRYKSKTMLRRIALLSLLWGVGLYLRMPILMAPPLVPFLSQEISLSQTALGLLTTLPVLMLAFGAIPGSLAIARFGARNTLVLALLLVVIGSSGRGLAPPTVLLFLFTLLMGFGIAAMQPALPVLLPQWCKGFVALSTAVYMNGMLMGEFIGAGLTLPVLFPLTEESWRATLLLGSLPAIIIALALMFPKAEEQNKINRNLWLPQWNDKRVWQLGLVLGGAATAFFGTNAYMVSILEVRGDKNLLGLVLFLFNISQVIASLLVMATARRWMGRRLPLMLATLSTSCGLLIFTVFDGYAAVAGAIIVGFFSAIQIILLVSLPSLTTQAGEAGKISAGMFSIGYFLAFMVPLIGGFGADYFQFPLVALFLMLAFVLLTVPFAFRLKV